MEVGRAPGTGERVGSNLPPVAFGRGTPGGSAAAEYRRRLARDEAALEARFGRLGGLVAALAGERPSTRAWSTGADGERHVGAALEQRLGRNGVVLHDRRVPGTRGNIDHIAVAPSGVWVVDAKVYRGRVWRRDVGGWARRDLRLYVGRTDRRGALEGVRRQSDTLERTLLRDFGEDAPPLNAVVCLVGADWGFAPRPFRIDGVWIAWPRLLGRMLRRPVVLEASQIEQVAGILARRFPVR